jgi:hypothetical protein
MVSVDFYRHNLLVVLRRYDPNSFSHQAFAGTPRLAEALPRQEVGLRVSNPQSDFLDLFGNLHQWQYGSKM